jgi:hypothetical protein
MATDNYAERGNVGILLKSTYAGDANAAVSKLNSASNSSFVPVQNETGCSQSCTYQSNEQGGVLATFVPLNAAWCPDVGN